MGSRYANWRLWHVLYIPHACLPNGRGSPLGLLAPRAIRACPIYPYRPAGWHLRSRSSRQDWRRCRDECHTDGRRDPQLLVRHDVGSDLCD